MKKAFYFLILTKKILFNNFTAYYFKLKIFNFF